MSVQAVFSGSALGVFAVMAEPCLPRCVNIFSMIAGLSGHRQLYRQLASTKALTAQLVQNALHISSPKTHYAALLIGLFAY